MNKMRVKVTMRAVPLPAEKKPLFDHSCLMLLEMVENFSESRKTAFQNDGPGNNTDIAGSGSLEDSALQRVAAEKDL